MILLVLTWVFGLLMIYLHNYQCFEYVFLSLYVTLGLFVFIRLAFMDTKVGTVSHLYTQSHKSTRLVVYPVLVDGTRILSTGEGGVLCKVLAERQEWFH